MCPPTLSPCISSPIHLHCSSDAKRECIYCINVNPVVFGSVRKGWGRKLSWKIKYDFRTENASPWRSKIWRLSFCKCVLPPLSFPVSTLPISVCRNWYSPQVNNLSIIFLAHKTWVSVHLLSCFVACLSKYSMTCTCIIYTPFLSKVC